MNDVDYTIDVIKNHPYVIAQDVGFKDVRRYPHNEWMHEIMTGKTDYTLLAHRGSYKSSVLSVCIALFMIVKPDSNIIFLRKADNDVSEMIRMVKKALESETLQRIAKVLYKKPIEFKESTASAITTNLYMSASGASQLLGIGLKSSITGKHADLVITDDICNVLDRTSKAERDKTKLQYQELQNIRNRGGRIINLGTRWHSEDVFTLMDNIHTYDCHETGLISDEQLQKIRESMSPSLFACNYELQIIAAENALFETAPRFFNQPELLRDGIAHIDAAYGGEDYTAFTCAKRVGETIYICGKLWHNHVDTVLERIIADAERLMCAPIYCEDNGDKGFLGKEIRRLAHDMPVRIYHESENKYLKISTYLRKWWNNIVWLQGTDKEYIQQIMDYTEDAEHDDACLAGDTLISTLTGDKPIKNIKTGECVITPAGVRKVLFAGVTGYKVVQNYHGLFATPDHKIFNKADGTFTRADSLTCAASYDIISLKELIIWKTKLLSSTAKSMSEIQRADITSSIQREIVNAEEQNSCTVPSGNITMVQSQKGITFTILMVMSIITTLVTWSVYRLGNICRTMLRKILRTKNTDNTTKNSCLHSKRKRKSGTKARKDANGIDNTRKNLFLRALFTALKNGVNTAVKCILERCNSDSVLKVAVKKQGGEESGLNSCLAKDNAQIVGSRSPRTMSGTNFVVQNVSSDIIPVYNLTVEKAGCYYANGILVSNCDSAASICRLLDRKGLSEYNSPFGG